VVFRLLDGSGRLAVAHLTWRRGLESLPWPFTTIYADEADLRSCVHAEDREHADASPCAVEGGPRSGRASLRQRIGRRRPPQAARWLTLPYSGPGPAAAR
jgi:hypothetical protein